MMDWHENLITNEVDIAEILRSAKRVAVLGIRSERFSSRAAFYVPSYLDRAGVEVIPVPVYEPEVTTILGKPVYRRLADIPGEIDILDVFRRAFDIPPHIPDIIKLMPKAVWFQLGIRNDEAAEELARAGMKVIQNRCIMVDHRHAVAQSKPNSL
jgi:predicted CoA-binding protein